MRVREMGNEVERIQFSACVKKGDDIYFPTRYGNFYMKLNLITKRTEYIDFEVDDKEVSLGIADYIDMEDNVIFQFNLDGRYVLLFDLDSKQIKKIDVDCQSKGWGNYLFCTYYDEKLFIFTKYKHTIAIINLKNNQVICDDKICKYICENDLPDLSAACKVNDQIWLFSNDGKKVVSYNLSTHKEKWYELPLKINQCRHCIYRNKKFYILDNKGNIYVWDKKQEYLLFSIPNAKPEEYGRIVATDKNLVVLPALGESIYIYDFSKNEIQRNVNYPLHFKYSIQSEWSKYYGFCEDENNYFFAMRLSNYLLKIKKQDGTIEWISPVIPDLRETIDRCKRYSNNTYLEGMISLSEYIKEIV